MRFLLAILSFVILCVAGDAIAASYRFRTDDILQISVWQEPKLNRQVVVAPDGSIVMPLAGRIIAGGRTEAQVAQSIKARLSLTYKGDLDVTVSFAGRPQKEPSARVDPFVFVMGEVNKPGPIVLRLRTSIVQALAHSGGLSPYAAEKRIQVHRKIKGVDRIYKFNFAEFKRGLNPSGNITLRAGDVVIVPERGLFE